METHELHKRNEAIALFDGWGKIDRGENYYALYYKEDAGASIDDFGYRYDWNWLMPVVEKIRREVVGLGMYETKDKYGTHVDYHGPNGEVVAYCWIRGKFEFPSDEYIWCDSYITAYFMAVSDYCMAHNARKG